MRKHIEKTLGINNIPNLQNRCLQYEKAYKHCMQINFAKVSYTSLQEHQIWQRMESIQIDLLEMGKSDKQNCYLVVIDEMTNFVFLRALLLKKKNCDSQKISV